MATITLNNRQLGLIQKALDLYSRVGILQIDQILEHPTVEKLIVDRFSPKRGLEVGDTTMRGTVVEIGEGYVKTEGSWGNGTEVKTWHDPENVEHSPDWSEVHATRDLVRQLSAEIKRAVSGQNYGTNSSMGIHHPSVDESCREAFDLIQIIRHEFWKANENRSSITVDSSIHRTSALSTASVKVEIDKPEQP